MLPDSLDALGWRLSADGFRIVLTTGLPAVVADRIGDCVRGFLAGHGLTVADVESWICHPGGPHVIDAVQQSLGLSDRLLAPSRRSLARVATCPPPRSCTCFRR